MAFRGTAEFRFYEELNDFLPEERRRRDFVIEVDRARSVKDAIESVGVPHTEVDLILVDGQSVGFAHRLRGGERVSVYPMFERLDITPVVRLRPLPMRDPRFVADVHLGKLARHLRMAGFDTLWTDQWDDDELIQISAVQKRTILTRDKGMLRRREVERGYFVRATESEAQLAEVIRALQLEGALAAFTRCRECNVPLEEVLREAVVERLPEKVRATYQRFKHCPGCERIYWEGTHYKRMESVLAKLKEEFLS
ncbi:MAG TPA: Mut7-C RNAse domain-containing protein [Usitatibacter sp.]|nr:Mut7-C RNAse domain-containing protein [Usitatibacter sp.]